MAADRILAALVVAGLFAMTGALFWIRYTLGRIQHRLGAIRFEVYRLAQTSDRYEQNHRPEQATTLRGHP